MSDLYVASKGGMAFWNGQRHRIRRGETIVRAGHPILAGREHMFEPLRIHYDAVEQATAAPGEKRNVTPSNAPPPRSGPGSGIEAWRSYVASRSTNLSPEDLAELSRDELIELVG